MQKIGHVLNYQQAMKFVPDRPTAIIRICEVESRDYRDARGSWDNSPSAPLVESPLWRCIFSYRFGDVDPDRHILYEGEDSAAHYFKGSEHHIITPEIADQMLQDFRSIPDEVTCYVFHCNAGASRSPATATAINEIFKLNLEWGARAQSVFKRFAARSGKGHHPSDIVGNLTVYNRLHEAAMRLRI